MHGAAMAVSARDCEHRNPGPLKLLMSGRQTEVTKLLREGVGVESHPIIVLTEQVSMSVSTSKCL